MIFKKILFLSWTFLGEKDRGVDLEDISLDLGVRVIGRIERRSLEDTKIVTRIQNGSFIISRYSFKKQFLIIQNKNNFLFEELIHGFPAHFVFE